MLMSARSLGVLAASCALGILSLTGYLPPPPATHPAIRVPSSILPSGYAPPVERLQQYLRVRTDHPHPDYHAAAAFLNETIAKLLPTASIRVVELVQGKPIVIATLAGSDPALPALMVNSHTDVVPVEPAFWHWDPFAADIAYVDYQWRVYARGAQDMKSIGMQYVEALAELYRDGWTPDRTVHVTFVPDEEIGGVDGFGKLVEGGRSSLWRELNVGAELDEGLPNPDGGFKIYYGERQPWWLIVEAEGAPSHAALAPDNPAAQAIHRVVDRALQFRERERGKLRNSSAGTASGTGLDIGETVGVNVVFLDSGIRSTESMSGYIMNMVPSKARVGFDIRVPPHFTAEQMEAEIASWLSCGEEGKPCRGLSHYFQHKVVAPEVTARDHPYSRAFMAGLRKALKERPGRSGPDVIPGIFHASTDARYARAVGIPSIGFSPIERTPDLLHKHDEFISIEGYLTGIKMYKAILRSLAGVWPADEPADEPALDKFQEEQLHTVPVVDKTPLDVSEKIDL